jgi:hypothetical protein
MLIDSLTMSNQFVVFIAELQRIKQIVKSLTSLEQQSSNPFQGPLHGDLNTKTPTEQ